MNSGNGPFSPTLATGSDPRTYSPRRSSYAAIAAGNAAVVSPARGITNGPSHGGEAASPQAMEHSRHPSRTGIDAAIGAGAEAKPASWRPDGRGGFAQYEENVPFFVPTYLRHSRHLQHLRKAHDAKEAEAREHAQNNPLKQTSLSRSSSNVTLNKMHHSHYHRPAVQDVIERRPPPSEEDRLHPLPTRWNEDDMQLGLEVLTDGTEVRFAGVTKSADEAASIRTDFPMPKECGLYYFEVTVLSRGKDGLIGVGFSSKEAKLNRLPGWEADSSWAYHGDDGYCFACTANGKPYGPRFSSQDVIGCGVNFRTGNAFFTKNGHYLGTAFTGVRGDKLYPSVGMKKPGEHLRINFGKQPFVFDIDRMMQQERASILEEIGQADVSELNPPDTEQTIIHKLISQYLVHEGYVETAKAFAQDVRVHQVSLDGHQVTGDLTNSEDDVQAINRQKIRRAILDGDIDKALKYTITYYPRVLEEESNKDVFFRLKCRKFIEMMRRYSELATAESSPVLARSMESIASNGHDGTMGEQQYANGSEPMDTQMELDEQINREASKSMAASNDVDMDESIESLPKTSLMKESNLLALALAYGQELRHEFGSDPRPQIKKQLQDLFAIMAYSNPAESPIAHLLDPQGRAQIAEEVNGAILVSLGKPFCAALEKLCAQTEALLDQTANKASGPAAFINVRKDFLQP